MHAAWEGVVLTYAAKMALPSPYLREKFPCLKFQSVNIGLILITLGSPASSLIYSVLGGFSYTLFNDFYCLSCQAT